MNAPAPSPQGSAARSIPSDVVCLKDYERHARQAMAPSMWAYLHGGAGDERTAQANHEAWARMSLLPRVLRHTAGGNTRTTLLGRTCAHPLMLAPVAYQRLAHADGEAGAALAAAAQEAGFVLSTQSSTPLEEVARAVVAEPGRGPLWMQLYLQADRGFTRALIQRIKAAGFEAIVLTIDAPCSGVRDQERREGFRLPPEVSAVNLQGMRARPDVALEPDQSRLFDSLLQHAPTWDDIAWLQSQTSLPILLKGVLHADDARQAQSLGVAGIIVSNHGGRTLDTAVSTAWALPRVADAVGSDFPLLVDGGIRRGTDVLKALALGAQAVMIGRPFVHALATAGALGVAHVIRLLRDEFEIAMALTGCRTIEDIRGELIAAP